MLALWLLSIFPSVLQLIIHLTLAKLSNKASSAHISVGESRDRQSYVQASHATPGARRRRGAGGFNARRSNNAQRPSLEMPQGAPAARRRAGVYTPLRGPHPPVRGLHGDRHATDAARAGTTSTAGP